MELRGLGDIHRKLAEQNGAVIAICVDSVEENRRVKEKNNLPFDILSDSDARVIADYGLLFREPMRGIDIALPANFLLDAQGRVAWKWIAPRVQDRVDPEVVEAQIEMLLKRPS